MRTLHRTASRATGEPRLRHQLASLPSPVPLRRSFLQQQGLGQRWGARGLRVRGWGWGETLHGGALTRRAASGFLLRDRGSKALTLAFVCARARRRRPLVVAAQGTTTVTDTTTTTTATSTTATSTTETTTTTTETTAISVDEPSPNPLAVQSTIFATNAEVDTVKGWVAADLPAFEGKPVTLTRCYSMTDDGDGDGAGYSVTFHAACDDKGPTVTVVQASNGHRFGGVADKSWTLDDFSGFTYSDVAFLFCLDCFGPVDPREAKAHQLKLINKGGQAQGHYASYGPLFGNGNPDLFLTEAGQFVDTSRLGTGYTCPIGQKGEDACQRYMSGSPNKDTPANWEVFVMA